MATNHRDSEGMPEALKQFASDVLVLVRQEIELARAEMTEKVKSAGVGAGILSGSALAAIFTLASLTGLVVIALSLVLPLWASMLLVTVLWAGTTAILGLLGKKKVADAAPFLPEQTIANVKEDIEWARSGKALRK